jgi:DNA-binding LytR/AlgR family response regulator
MFIKSEDNYVQIHYLDRNRIRKFILRSSMRALEEGLESIPISRKYQDKISMLL